MTKVIVILEIKRGVVQISAEKLEKYNRMASSMDETDYLVPKVRRWQTRCLSASDDIRYGLDVKLLLRLKDLPRLIMIR